MPKQLPEELRREISANKEASWEKINNELRLKGGVNPLAYFYGYENAATEYAQKYLSGKERADKAVELLKDAISDTRYISDEKLILIDEFLNSGKDESQVEHK